jgi:hypothetical protein
MQFTCHKLAIDYMQLLMLQLPDGKRAVLAPALLDA